MDATGGSTGEGAHPMTEPLRERWSHCKAAIGRRIGPEDAGAWLDALRLERVEPGRVVLTGIPNSFFRNRIAARFRPVILESLREGFPDVDFHAEPALELRVDGEAGNGSAVRPAPPATPPERPQRPHGPGTFAAFVEAAGNAEALHFAREVAAAPGRRYNPLLLVGETGLGKTHLLQAVANALGERHADWRVLTCTGEAFKNELLEGITNKRTRPLREQYRTVDALLVDDLHYLLVSPRAQEELVLTFDALHRAGRQIVVTATRFPGALQGLLPALRSRLEMGLIAELTPLEADARLGFVQARAAREGVALPEEVARLLAGRVTRNLRQLEGVVVRLAAYAALHGQAVTPAFAEQVAAPFFDADPAGASLPVAHEAILERVADRFGLAVRTLKGRGRTPHIVAARRVAIHLLKTLGHCSYAEIGALLGRRTHSTMVHGHHTLHAAMARDATLRRKVEQLARELSA